MDATTIGFGLAVLTALGWSAYDVARKKAAAGMSATGALAMINAVHLPILFMMFAAGALTSPEEGSALEVVLPEWSTPPAAYAWQYAVSLGFNVLANVMFMRAVAVSPLSLTIPYLSFTPVFTAAIALAVYGTSPSLAGWAGVAMVCAGAFVLNPGNPEAGPLAPLRALGEERGSLYMIGVAFLWSTSALVDQSAAGGTSPTFHSLMIAAGLTSLYGAWRSWASGGLGWVRQESEGKGALIMAAGVVSLFAYFSQLVAFSYVDVAYVETIKRALGVLISVGVGYAVFGEGDLTRRAVAALVMVSGVALVMLWG
jgi:drug/metabolite transporter (DMT)-like permease